MLKPHVLTLPPRWGPAAPTLHTVAVPLSDGGAARFARTVLERSGGAEERYPEAWLVFREEEEAQAAQTEGELHLNELTLRLVLQLSQYLSLPAAEREAVTMERQTLLHSFRTCLTALETRDREISREVQTVFGRLIGLPQEQTARTDTVEHLRERLERRIQTLRERVQVQERTVPPALPISRLVERSRRTVVHPVSLATSHQMGRPEVHIWRTGSQGAPKTSMPEPTEDWQLMVQKERFLQLFFRADREEQERVWALIEHQRELIPHYHTRLEQLEGLDWEEKLTTLVRESTRQEYSALLRTLERTLSRREVLPGASTSEVHTSTAEIEASPPHTGGETTPDTAASQALSRRTAPAEPVVKWLAAALEAGPVRREELLERIRSTSQAAQTAFLELIRESGVFSPARQARVQAAPAEEQLSILVKESRRRELTALVRWVAERRSEEPGLSSPTPAIAPEEAGAAPTVPAPAAQAEDRVTLTELRSFLTEQRTLRRTELRQLLETARPEEQLALLTAAAPDGTERPTSWTEESRETLVYLIQHSEDPAALAERLASTEAVRVLERQTERERTILDRLTAYVQSRGGSWQTERERLLAGLTGAEERVLLRRITDSGAVRAVPGAEPDKPETPGEELERLLTFQSQKAYKSFRYRLNEYLRTVQVPRESVTTVLKRWAEESRRTEGKTLAQKAAPVLAHRPVAWTRLLLGAADRRDAPDTSKVLQAVSRGEGLVYARLLHAVEGTEPPPGLLEAVLPQLSAAVPRPEQDAAPTTVPTAQIIPGVLAPMLSYRELKRTMEEYTSETVAASTLEQLTKVLPNLPVTRWREYPAPAASRTEVRTTSGVPAPELSYREGRQTKEKHTSKTVTVSTLERLTRLLPGLPVTRWREYPAPAASQTEVRTTSGVPAPELSYREGPQMKEEHTSKTVTVSTLERLTRLLPGLPVIRWREYPTPAASQTEVQTIPGVPVPMLSYRELERTKEERTSETITVSTLGRLTKLLPSLPVIRWREGPAPAVSRAEVQTARASWAPLLKHPGPERREEEQVTTSTRLPRLLTMEPTPATPSGVRMTHRQVFHLAGTAEERLRPTSGLTVPGLREPEEERNVFPASPELALRRESPGREAVRETARRSAEQSAEQAIRQQAPELQFLRRQDQVRSQALEEQKRDLKQLWEQMERQEKLVRQAMEHSLPQRQDPAQIRNLARAVMKEMEQQLRLERQRRGLF